MNSELQGKTGIQLYAQAFTHSSISDDNYEVFEWLGDLTANTCICWYLTRTYPKLFTLPNSIKVIATVKKKLVSKNIFFPFAEKLGCWDWISAGTETRYVKSEPVVQFVRNVKKKKLLCDSLESIIGVTQLLLDSLCDGTGYKICYNLIEYCFKNFYGKISLHYEDIVDSKTILKELFDHNQDLLGGKIIDNDTAKSNYRSEKVLIENSTYSKYVVQIIANINGQFISLGTSEAPKKEDAKQNAAKIAIQNLKSKYSVIPRIAPHFDTVKDW